MKTNLTPKALRAAATSVAGARGMGIETSASKAAPAMLEEAHAWLRAESDGSQFSSKWQALHDAAWVLAVELGVCPDPFGPQVQEEEEASSFADQDAANAEEWQASNQAILWEEAHQRTKNQHGEFVDYRGVPVAQMVVRGESYGIMPGIQQEHVAFVAKDGRTVSQEWITTLEGREYWVTSSGTISAMLLGVEGSHSSEWLPGEAPAVLSSSRSEMGVPMDWEDAFKAQAAEKAAMKAARHSQTTNAPVSAMQAAFAALRKG